MNLTILIPFFGETERFRPLLREWFASYKSAGLKTSDVVLITDNVTTSVSDAALEHGAGVLAVDVTGFRDLMRPGQAFDHKGAIVCAALLRWEKSDPLLVLDADAFIVSDPRPHLAPFVGTAISMPADHGALIFYRTRKMNAPFGEVRKLCAGVQFFAGDRSGRSRLVAGYRRAFEEIVALGVPPWTPPLRHLTEQYAWSVAAHRRGCKVLPITMNWAPVHLGDNPFAIINHHFGLPKWDELPKA